MLAFCFPEGVYYVKLCLGLLRVHSEGAYVVKPAECYVKHKSVDEEGNECNYDRDGKCDDVLLVHGASDKAADNLENCYDNVDLLKKLVKGKDLRAVGGVKIVVGQEVFHFGILLLLYSGQKPFVE